MVVERVYERPVKRPRLMVPTNFEAVTVRDMMATANVCDDK